MPFLVSTHISCHEHSIYSVFDALTQLPDDMALVITFLESCMLNMYSYAYWERVVH